MSVVVRTWLWSSNSDDVGEGRRRSAKTEDGWPRCRRVVLAIEGIEQLGDHTGLGHSGDPQRADVVRLTSRVSALDRLIGKQARGVRCYPSR